MPKPEEMPPARCISSTIMVMSATALMLGRLFFCCCQLGNTMLNTISPPYTAAQI